MWGVGYGAWGLGSGLWGVRCGVWGKGVGVRGLGYGVSNGWFQVDCCCLWVSVSGDGVHGSGGELRLSGSGV